MKKTNSAILALFFIFLGCATVRAPHREGYDFSGIRKVYFEEFQSMSAHESSGGAVRDAFIREFMRRGYVVTGNPLDSDVIVTGSVIRFAPEKRYLIFLSRPGEKRIVVNQPIELGGSNVHTFGSAFGLREDNQIMISNATVGVSAVMKDARSREVIWANAHTHEGLDLSVVMDSVVWYLVRTIPK